MSLCPIATPKLVNQDGGAFIGVPWRVVWHTTQNSNIQQAYNELVRERFAAHFLVDENNTWQLLDTGRAARALQNRAGGVETNRANAIQIELVAFAEYRKSAKLMARARLLALWLASAYQIPWVWPAGPSMPPVNGKDGNRHNRDPKTWYQFGGHYGHEHVPENIHWDPAFYPDEQAFLASDPNKSAASYIVQAGDTLYSISRKIGASVASLIQANSIVNPALINVGQVLKTGG